MKKEQPTYLETINAIVEHIENKSLFKPKYIKYFDGENWVVKQIES